MKRDFDLIREILLKVESRNKINDLYFPDIEGYDEDVIFYHVKLLGEAGFCNVYDASTKSGIDYRVLSLTYAGHEFLDQIRSPKVWEKTKETVLKKIGSLTVDAIKTVSSEIIKSVLKGDLL
jgi:hypothetical protein